LKKIYKYKTIGYLKQGDIQLFKVIRIITIPNNNKYFVLQDFKKNKHLLPFKLYENYNFKINSEIKCKIDKINCVGRIFLEPQHFYFSINKNFEFEYITDIEIVKKNKNRYKYHKFIGKYNFTALLPFKHNKNKLKKYSKYIFEIDRISKAIIYLK